MKRLNPNWQATTLEAINNGQEIDITSREILVIQWLVETLTLRKRPFKVYNPGVGVRRITTNTTTCPCCKQPLK